MNMNVGTHDRRIRLVAGVVLILLPFLAGFDSNIARAVSIVIGLILLLTGTLNSCPAYSMLGINTRSRD